MDTLASFASNLISTTRSWFSEISNSSEKNFTNQQRRELQESLHEIARDCERQVLSHTGLNLTTEVQINDITIEESSNGDHQWIHTIFCEKQKSPLKNSIEENIQTSNQLKIESPPTIVLLHGFASNLPGMGLSSKPEWNLSGPQENIEHFVESIDKWRQKVGIDKFTLVGHSLGGYIAGQYALHYPDRLDKIVLLSAAGITNQSEEEIKAHIDNSPFHHKIFFGFLEYAWKNEFTVNKELKFLPAEKIMRQYMKTFSLPQNEHESWSRYYDKMLLLPESGEKTVYHILQYPRCNAILPLEELFPGNLKVPAHFCYGGTLDWMCKTGAKKLITEKKIEGTYREVEHFDHQFTFLNPEEASDYILSLP